MKKTSDSHQAHITPTSQTPPHSSNIPVMGSSFIGVAGWGPARGLYPACHLATPIHLLYRCWSQVTTTPVRVLSGRLPVTVTSEPLASRGVCQCPDQLRMNTTPSSHTGQQDRDSGTTTLPARCLAGTAGPVWRGEHTVAL